MLRVVSAVIAAVVLSLAIGCGSEVDRKEVSGEVTFAGKPIVFGQIMFVPETKDKIAPTGEAEIVDGRFDTSLPGGRGIVPGPHQIRVTAFTARPPETSDDETLPSLSEPPIFAGYVFKADVAAGENSFDVPEAAKGFGLGTGQPARRSNDP